MAHEDPGHWFWRGVQSAIFYYVSLTPCLEARRMRNRRKEARDQKIDLITQQPGVTPRTMAFETDERWREEIILGPGPPKGWKSPTHLRDAKKEIKREAKRAKKKGLTPPQPLDQRRWTSAIMNVKDSLRNMHPWKSDHRPDEVLTGLQNTVTRAWDKITTSVGYDDDEPESSTGRKRAYTSESDKIDYTRGYVPAINDLHPPVVSQLPATPQEAAWMVAAPPSAAVMMGRRRETEETASRKPMCVVGRPPRDVKLPPKLDDVESLDGLDLEAWDATSIESEECPDLRNYSPIKRQSLPTNLFDSLSEKGDPILGYEPYMVDQKRKELRARMFGPDANPGLVTSPTARTSSTVDDDPQLPSPTGTMQWHPEYPSPAGTMVYKPNLRSENGRPRGGMVYHSEYDLVLQQNDYDITDGSIVIPTAPNIKRRELRPSLFDSLSETDVSPLGDILSVRPRPASWQFHYVLPAAPAPAHLQ